MKIKKWFIIILIPLFLYTATTGCKQDVSHTPSPSANTKHLDDLRNILEHLDDKWNWLMSEGLDVFRGEFEVEGKPIYGNFTDASGLIYNSIKHCYGYGYHDWTLWMDIKDEDPYRPQADDFYNAILAEYIFDRIDNIEDIKPGDILAIDYEESSTATGHVMVINAKPELVDTDDEQNPKISDTRQYTVQIIDSTGIPHDPGDSRYVDGRGVDEVDGAGVDDNGESDEKENEGIGKGTLRLYVNNDGTFQGYATRYYIWGSTDLTKVYHPSVKGNLTFYGNTYTGRPIAIGRYINGEKLFPPPTPAGHLEDLRDIADHIQPEWNHYTHNTLFICRSDEPFYANYTDCSGLLYRSFEYCYGYNYADWNAWMNIFDQYTFDPDDPDTDYPRPRAIDFYNAIADEKGFTRIYHIDKDVNDKIKVGDLFAIDYNGAASDTGHLMVIDAEPVYLGDNNNMSNRDSMNPPYVDDTYQYSVQVIDSTSIPHDPEDSRYIDGYDGDDGDEDTGEPEGNGIGRGTLRIYVNYDGTFQGYATRYYRWGDADRLVNPELRKVYHPSIEGSLTVDGITYTGRPIAFGRLNTDYNPAP